MLDAPKTQTPAAPSLPAVSPPEPLESEEDKQEISTLSLARKAEEKRRVTIESLRIPRTAGLNSGQAASASGEGLRIT
jgi:hypothetical protein